MREYLDNEGSKFFAWPDEGDLKHETHFMFPHRGTLGRDDLFVKERVPRPKLRKLETYIVEQCKIKKEKLAQMNFFEHPFAVKRAKDWSPTVHTILAEAVTMKGLLHPHISALLGTFYDPNFQYILTFPIGRTDLLDFLQCFSRRREHDGRILYKIGDDAPSEKEYNEILEKSEPEQLAMLQGWFLCLCQAVAYLHAAHVRHKDIKPENIIIDFSYSVIIIDFDVSGRAANPMQLGTSTERHRRTWRYMPPERDRDCPADVWCLGLVFLEMISPLFGRTLGDCNKACFRSTDPETDPFTQSYRQELDRAVSYLSTFRMHEFKGQVYHEQAFESIKTIQMMIKREPSLRPQIEGLWESFDFAPAMCIDCHPQSTDLWKPTKAQLEKLESSKSALTAAMDNATDLHVRPRVQSPQGLATEPNRLPTRSPRLPENGVPQSLPDYRAQFGNMPRPSTPDSPKESPSVRIPSLRHRDSKRDSRVLHTRFDNVPVVIEPLPSNGFETSEGAPETSHTALEPASQVENGTPPTADFEHTVWSTYQPQRSATTHAGHNVNSDATTASPKLVPPQVEEYRYGRHERALSINLSGPGETAEDQKVLDLVGHLHKQFFRLPPKARGVRVQMPAFGDTYNLQPTGLVSRFLNRIWDHGHTVLCLHGWEHPEDQPVAVYSLDVKKLEIITVVKDWI